MTELALPRLVVARKVMWHPGPAVEVLRDAFLETGLDGLRRERFRRLRRALDDALLMASGKSSDLSAKLKNEVFGAVAYAAVADHFFGLWTTAAATDMDAFHGGTAGEVASAGAYDRVQKANNTTNFASITGDAAKVNSTAITWAQATANWNSGNPIPQCGVFTGNAKTSADLLVVWGDFTVAKSVLLNDTFQIATSAFSYTEE